MDSNSLLGMRKVLVTGMSGTGKSTAMAELAKRGFQVVETDDVPWSEWSEADGGYVWREDLVAELLSRDGGGSHTNVLATSKGSLRATRETRCIPIERQEWSPCFPASSPGS